MFEIGKQVIGSPKPIVTKPKNLSGAELIRRIREQIRNDKYRKAQEPPSTIPIES